MKIAAMLLYSLLVSSLLSRPASAQIPPEMIAQADADAKLYSIDGRTLRMLQEYLTKAAIADTRQCVAQPGLWFCASSALLQEIQKNVKPVPETTAKPEECVSKYKGDCVKAVPATKGK